MVKYLEKLEPHSKPRLALAILTSPGPAFEEILRRKLLGTAILLVAATGVLSSISAIAHIFTVGSMQIFALGKNNPLTWIGLCMLYAFALQMLLKWIGTQIDYTDALMILGWSQVLLLLQQATGAALGLIGPVAANTFALQFLNGLYQFLPVLYVIVIGTGVRVACRVPPSRGIMAYFVVAAAALIAFGYTYSQARFDPFRDALPGIMSTVGIVVSVDHTPWIAASLVGLIAGLPRVGKSLGWNRAEQGRIIALAAVLGAAVFGLYTCSFYRADYYGKLLTAQRLYDQDKFEPAAAALEKMLPLIKDKAELTLGIGCIHFAAGNNDAALDCYNRFIVYARKAKLGKQEGMFLAHGYNGIGAVYDIQGKHDLAIAEFEKATRAWPEFRDPWVRMAITYDRMGNYGQAIDSANHAIKNLTSKAPLAWVALAEAYAQTGQTKKARDAMDNAAKLNDDLAAKFGKDPNGWKTSTDKLKAVDLQFPLEKEIAPPPAKPEPKKPTSKR